MAEQPSGTDSAALSAQMRHFMHLVGQAAGRPAGRDASSGQGRVLKLLSLHSPVAQKELAYVLGIRSQSLAELLAKLEEKGLIAREPNPDDRRTSIVTLTEPGRRAAAAQKTAEVFDPFAALTTTERAELDRLLRTLISATEAQMDPREFPPAPLQWPPPPPPGDEWGPPPPPRRPHHGQGRPREPRR